VTAYRVIESSGSNGSIQFAVDGDFSSSGNFVFITGSERLGVGTASPDARLHVSGGTILGSSASDLHQVTGSAVFVTGLTGSLTQIPGGLPYLVAGSNVSISTGSNGQITISASSSGGGSDAILSEMSWMETPSGVIDGVNLVFTLSQSPSPINSLMLYVNGVLQSQGLEKDYTISDNIVVMTSTPVVGSQIVATYSYQRTPTAGTRTSWMEVPGGVINGINNVYTLMNAPHPASALMLYYNGVLQRQGVGADYEISGGSSIVTNFIPELGSNILAMYPY